MPDNDECALGTDMCSQSCRDTLGSYTCSCQSGYTLAADGHACNGMYRELGPPLQALYS